MRCAAKPGCARDAIGSSRTTMWKNSRMLCESRRLELNQAHSKVSKAGNHSRSFFWAIRFDTTVITAAPRCHLCVEFCSLKPLVLLARCQVTVSVTLVVCVVPPDVPVTVMEYEPTGVPLGL